MSRGNLSHIYLSFFLVPLYNLNNLVAIIDRNRLQSIEDTESTLALEPLSQKLETFNWEVKTIDGHNHKLLNEEIISERNSSKVIMGLTVKGKGYEMFENNGILSIYIEKSRQLDYLSHCKKSKLILSGLSLDILSADYVARKMFDADQVGDYVIWALGKQKDDMLIVKNNRLAGLVSFKRLRKGFEILKKIGSQKLI